MTTPPTNPMTIDDATAMLKELQAVAAKWNVSMDACSCCEGLNVDGATKGDGNILSMVWIGPDGCQANFTNGDPYHKVHGIDTSA